MVIGQPERTEDFDSSKDNRTSGDRSAINKDNKDRKVN